MIVYNVKRRWFTMKNDAEAYRRAEGLPKGSTFKLDIRDRDDLAGLLNGLCAERGALVKVPDGEDVRAYGDMLQRNTITDDVPDFVPDFLANEWRKRVGLEVK